MKTKKELKKLALDDLRRSGLDDSDFKKMKLQVCNYGEAEIVLNSSFCTFGYVLPYFDIKGKQINNIRFRFLEALKRKENKEGGAKLVKYSQPKGTEPKLYFPPSIKWSAILEDNKKVIVFTEGEKKAYAACKNGIATIGLGGVWSFKSKKQQKSLIDDFKNINLKDRKILICYDNDVHTNADVLKALRAFAKALNDQGAKVLNKVLPFDPYSKIGLDDYLLTNNKKDFYNLPEEKFNSIVQLDELNSEIAYIKELGKVYIFKDNIFVSDKPLVNLVYANKLIPNESGDGSVSAAKIWLSWPNRRTHNKLTYKPAQPQVTSDNEFNLWRGWGCVPKKGSVKLFLDAVNQVFDNDKELITWFLNWVAYPIQYPGTKMLTAVLMQSIEQGTGKGSLGLCIGEMYGENYALIDDSQLSSQYNGWSVNKQFILGDEISGKDKRNEADKIKGLITRPSIPIRKMRTDTYFIDDCINYFFTSNHPDPLNLEPTDRRWLVHEIKHGNGLSLKQGKALEKFRDGDGTAALLYYFINEYKISKGFDHREKPPMTIAKTELIDHSLTDLERFISGIKTDPNQYLSINGAVIDRDLYTTSQIASLYEMNFSKVNVTLTAVGKALKKIFNESEIVTIRTSTGVQRVRALRNMSKWRNANHKKMQDHFDKSKIALFKAKKSKVSR